MFQLYTRNFMNLCTFLYKNFFLSVTFKKVICRLIKLKEKKLFSTVLVH